MSVSSATSTTIRRCRCGSTSHSRVTHHSCPLNPKKNNSEEFVPPPKVSENAENVPPPSQSNEKSTLNKEESVPSEQDDEGSKLATKQEEQKRKKLTQLRSASTKRTVEIDASTLPRISAESTSLTALKAEAKARGGIPPGYSRCSRKTLLEELGIGSILLSGTREFRFVERVKALMDREKNARERRTLDEDVRMRLELEDAKHTIKLPHLHPCPLAPASALLASAYWDAAGKRADLCCQCHGPCAEYKNPALSCLRCGYDICSDCLQLLAGGEKQDQTSKNPNLPKQQTSSSLKKSTTPMKTREPATRNQTNKNSSHTPHITDDTGDTNTSNLFEQISPSALSPTIARDPFQSRDSLNSEFDALVDTLNDEATHDTNNDLRLFDPFEI